MQLKTTITFSYTHASKKPSITQQEAMVEYSKKE